MMGEPAYVAQTGEAEHLASPKVWRDECLAQAREKGCTFFRFAYWPPIGALTALLVEGWEEPPEDQCEPRFGLTLTGR